MDVDADRHTFGTAENNWYTLKFSLGYTIVLAVLYVVALLFTLVGNLFVLISVWKNPSMHTVINYFICNLSLADILAGFFCIPITCIQSAFQYWVLGDLICRLSPFLQGCAVSASVATFTVVAFDRCLAICFPLKRFFTMKSAKIVICCIWLYSAFLMSPWFAYFGVHYKPINQVNLISNTSINNNLTAPLCFLEWPEPASLYNKLHFYGVIIVLCYVLPLSLTTACYVVIGILVMRRGNAQNTSAPKCGAICRKNASVELRQNSGNSVEKSIKIVKMLALVVIVFALCWLPLYTIHIFEKIVPWKDWSENTVNTIIHILPMFNWITYINNFVNPWIYCIFSRNFRDSFKRMFHTCIGFCFQKYNHHHGKGMTSSRNKHNPTLQYSQIENNDRFSVAKHNLRHIHHEQDIPLSAIKMSNIAHSKQCDHLVEQKSSEQSPSFSSCRVLVSANNDM